MRRKKMPIRIDVLKALSSQDYLIGYEERISMDPELASNNGVVVGQQVRIKSKKKPERYAIYTVHQFMQDGTDDNDVRMALAGRQRMDYSDSFSGYLEGCDEVALQGKTEQWLDDNNEFGEFLDETTTNHTKLVACAPHGGIIENYTDEQAERVYSQLDAQSKDVSAWRCKGWQDAIGAYDAWHITSTEISPESFPLLNAIKDRGFDYAVSFHGFGEADIAVGGGASATLKQEVADAIAAIPGLPYDVTVVSSGPYAGTSPDNFVNWLTSPAGNGVQIEQPYGARRDYGQAIADAVASVFASKI
jgi:phage replication-related protein YjqB (UPF0714/DUF867 family)